MPPAAEDSPVVIESDVVYVDACVQTGNVTAVSVFCVTDALGVVAAHGASVKHPDDKPNTKLGYDLALGRALKNLGTSLEAKAHRQVNHIEHQRAHQAKAKAAATERAATNGQARRAPEIVKATKATRAAAKAVAKTKARAH